MQIGDRAVGGGATVSSRFPAVVGEPDRSEYAETWLVAFSEHVKSTRRGYRQRMLRFQTARCSTSQVGPPSLASARSLGRIIKPALDPSNASKSQSDNAVTTTWDGLAILLALFSVTSL